MRLWSAGLQYPARSRIAYQRGITGLETAIILIAFVVVASVFAFTVLTTGLFSTERSKDTVFSGLEEAQSTLEPKGSAIAYSGKLSDGTQAIYKITLTIANTIAGVPVDLTPPYTFDDFLTDPDPASSNQYTTIISISDENQFLRDVPWTLGWVGNNDGDNLLEADETAAITIWLLDRNTPLPVTINNSIAVMDGGLEGGDGGITSIANAIVANDSFKIEINPPNGSVLSLPRKVPIGLDNVVALN